MPPSGPIAGSREKNRHGHRFRRAAPCAHGPRGFRVRHDGGGARRGCAAAAQQPAATPSGQKSGATGGRSGAAPSSPAAAEQHRLPPDSTTKQTLALPGRTLAFTATAGSIRLFNDKGEPQADIAYTAYQLDGADPRTRPVTFLFNGGPGAASAYLQFGAPDPGGWRSTATRRFPPRRPICSPTPRPGSTSPISSSSIRSAPAIAASSRPARTCASGFFGRRRRQLDRGDDPPLAGKVRPVAVAQICRRRKLWRHPRTEDRSQFARSSRASGSRA